MNVQEFTNFFIQDENILNFLKVIGVVTGEDLQEFNQDKNKEDLFIQNELLMHEWTQEPLEQRIKAGLSMDQEVDYETEQPWRSYLGKQVPERFSMKNIKNVVPPASLELEYIHGIQTNYTRNNLKYNTHKKLVYFQAAVGKTVT